MSDTRKRDSLERNSRGDGGFIVGKAAKGGIPDQVGKASRFDSDEMSLLYENRCLTVGLIPMRLRQSPAEC